MFNKLNLNQELQIVRFGGDYIPNPDTFDDLEILIKENEDLYPGIDLWYDKKVISGLRKSNRRAFVIYKNEKPVGAAVIKLGEDTKICSVRLTSEEQGRGIGRLLFSILAIEMQNYAKKVHFTAPESLWINKNRLFDNLGFKFYKIANEQYRLWDDEFYCGTDFNSFWNNVIKGLPKTIENITINGNSNHCDIVMSIKPDFAKKIVNGNKKIEIRRRFSSKWQRAKALIYASSPQRHFVGEAIIGDIHHAEPQKIWDNFKSDIGCSWAEYSNYCKGAEKVYAIIFADVNKFRYSIPKMQIETLIQKELTPPQSYCEAKEGSAWPTAVSMNCLLRAHLK